MQVYLYWETRRGERGKEKEGEGEKKNPFLLGDIFLGIFLFADPCRASLFSVYWNSKEVFKVSRSDTEIILVERLQNRCSILRKSSVARLFYFVISFSSYRYVHDTNVFFVNPKFYTRFSIFLSSLPPSLSFSLSLSHEPTLLCVLYNASNACENIAQYPLPRKCRDETFFTALKHDNEKESTHLHKKVWCFKGDISLIRCRIR